MIMPKLDGFELLHQLRADPALRDIPVVLLTAHAGDEPTAQALEHGADDLLVKPFSARELCARVGRQLSRSQTLRDRHPRRTRRAPL